jgi:hypothetical protein
VSTTTYTLSYAASLATFATPTITDPSLAVAQAMAQNAATVLQQAITLTSSALTGQSWTYNPGPAPVGYWVAQYNAVFAALGSSSTLNAQESAEGQTLASALLSAGQAYDTTSTAGVKNQSTYALQRNAWATVLAAPAWLELDRVCRYVYASIASNAQQTQAAFAGTAPTWQPSTSYGYNPLIDINGTPSFVIPSPPNGYCYSTYDYAQGHNYGTGESGSSQPSFPAGPLGATVVDNGSVTWVCVAATGSAGAALLFDSTLNALETLLLRYNAAVSIASASAPLLAMLRGAYSSWTTAAAAQPSANAALDAASATATANLNAALANAQTWVAAATFT